ncbi:DNA methyltransferase [Salinivibrio kushneri]|uniref:DNA methyltransferase n=1 Tax=Salinivibrio kushneri TaxID=1908198 RepID=UPI0022B3A0E7|nr:DNA methyltransferase [Salinivibrio kushneri]WBA11810.1 DNA methyltransferase [Salinivibrio kushneri]
MSNSTQQLKAEKRRKQFADLLREMFQLNQPELDFGLYRIMHARKDDINRFIERDLPNITKEAFKGFATQDKTQIEQELEKAVQGAKALDVDPESLPKVQELRAKLADNFDLAREEGEVYDALVTFFNRYYDEGDFLSRRIYKDGTYAIPYQGEEVVLHWANKDQYYIKSSETLRDYTFRLNPEAAIGEDPLRVHFKLVDAEAGAKDNNKEGDDSKRVFVLDREQPFELIDGESAEDGSIFQELQLRFHFRAATENDWTPDVKDKATAAAQKKAPTQDHLRTIAVNSLLSADSELPESWQQALKQPYRKADGDLADYPILQGQLNNYTKKNSFDYFIHKDLGDFLTRELDFYIKNELLDWDDIASLKNDPARLAPLLSKIEVIRSLGEKIIAFLAQLENFQKKLWLKKKFVTETNYCITLDQLEAHTELLEQVFDNKVQLKDWESLYALDLNKLEKDYNELGWHEILAMSQYRYLMVDTAHFDAKFKAQLIATFDDLDEQCDGLLVHSENLQALNLLQERYRKQIRCIYIDPPYNTASTPILYKNSYRHSSWASLMQDRMLTAKNLLSPEGVKIVAIDDTEADNLSLICSDLYSEYKLSKVTVVHNPKGSITKAFNRTHEYSLFLTPDVEQPIARTLEKNSTPRKMRRWGENSLRTDRRLSFYPIYVKNDKITRVGSVPDDSFHPESKNVQLESGEVEIWPIDQEGIERRWNFGLDSIESNLDRVVAIKNKGELDLFLTHEKSVPKTVWSGGEYDAGNYGNSLLIDMLGNKLFDFPKSINLVSRCIEISTLQSDNCVVLDYFGGSGTTAHSIIELNRRNPEVKRKYVVVEMGKHFDTVVKPRAMKATYSSLWKQGKPKLGADGNLGGISHCFKYIRLESYEDTLGNLALDRHKGQQTLLDSDDNSSLSDARQGYILNYILEMETRGSQSLLNTQQFLDPTRYELKVRSASGDETKTVYVDLLETFNYLLGLRVEHIAAPIHFDAEVAQGEFGRWQAKVKRNSEGVWWFRTVFGTNANGQKVLVVWRNLPSVIAGEEAGLQRDNAVLDAVLIEKLAIRLTESQDDEIDLLYVNGDHNIAIPRNRNGEPIEQARIQLIEEAFHRLMFAGTDSTQ